MRLSTNKLFRLSLSLTLINVLFPCLLVSADLRQRNIIISKSKNTALSSNNTDVININNPSQNGISHNQFDAFDIHKGVIFNNSLEDGISKIGGAIEKNPNLTKNASVIVSEITSKQASQINGILEVFGKKANLVFANENGFSVNGAAFLNTEGVTLSTGKFNDNFLNIDSDARIKIGNSGIIVDGDYFNVISRGIDIAGSIAHYEKGKNLSNINFIAGLNTVDLNNPNSPKISAKLTTQKDKKIDYGIDGKYLGSMYANKVTLISTEEGVGVRHSGVVRSIKDVMVKAKDKVEFQALGVNRNGSISIEAKEIQSSLINADNISLKAEGKITNKGLYRGNEITVNSNSFENAKTVDISKETKDIFKTNQKKSQIYAGTISVNATDKIDNFGSINVLNDIVLNTNSLNNKGEISANNNIDLVLSAFDNGGKIISQNNITLEANDDLDLNARTLHAKNLLDISSNENLRVNSKLENLGSIQLNARNIYINALVASGKDLVLHSRGSIENNGYLYSVKNTTLNALIVMNDSMIDSLQDLSINSKYVNNNSLIYASRDINIEAQTLNNIAQMIGSLTYFTDNTRGFGWANYGDTAFKRWNMEARVNNILKYINSLDSKQGIIQSSKNININTISRDRNRRIYNEGKILAKNNISTFGKINNVTLSKDITMREVFSKIKVGGFFAREYLGSWNTNSTHYFTRGESLLDALRYFSSNAAKNHQRESAWNALKDAARKNKTLRQYFSLLLGSNYASQRFVPNQNSWNLNAKMIFKAKSQAQIASNGRLNIVSSSITQGLSSSLNRDFALIESNVKKAVNSRDLILSSIPDIVNSRLFTINIHKDDVVSNDRGGLVGKAAVSIDTGSLSSSLSGISSEGQVNINASDEANFISSQLDGSEVNINANRANISTALATNEEGTSTSVSKTEIKGQNSVTINTNDDLNIQNSDITASAQNSQINLNSQDGDVNIKNDYSTSSSFTQEQTGDNVSTSSTQSNTVLSSNISADNLSISAKKDANIVSSNISSTSQQGSIDINAQNVNIADAQENTKIQNEEYSRSSTEINHKSTSLTTSTSQGSSLTSQNNININASNDVKITGSNIQAQNSANLNAKNISVNSGATKISSSSQASNTQIAGFRQTTQNVESSVVASSSISANNEVNLNAKDKVDIKGSNLKGEETNVNGNEVNFIAAQNQTHTQTNSLGVGIFANANLELGGQGISANYSHAGQIANTKKLDSESSITQGGLRSDLFGAGEVGVELISTQKTTNEVTNVSSRLEGSNINVNSNNTLDIGGANLKANKDINLKGGEIKSTKYADTKTHSSTGFSLSVKEKLESLSPIASFANQVSQNLHSEQKGLKPNPGIIAAQISASTVNMLSNNLVTGNSNQTIGFKFNQSQSSSSNENITQITAGENLNISSTKGNITLNGTNANANNISINSKKDLIVNAAKSKASSSNIQFEATITNRQTAGYHIIDGGVAGNAVEFFTNGSYSRTDESKFSNTTLNANNDVSIKTKNNTVLNGANVNANNVNLDIGKNLEINSLVDTSNSEKYGGTLSGTITGALSSNHIATGSVSGMVGFGYNKSNKAEVSTQSGFNAKNEINGGVGESLSLKAGILNSKVGSGNLEVARKVLESDVKTYEKSDGATVRINGGTNTSFGAVVDIEDHINKTGSANSASNININGNKNNIISTDTQNTQSSTDSSWAGGTVNFSTSVTKVKDAVNHIRGMNSNPTSSTNTMHVNEITETTRF